MGAYIYEYQATEMCHMANRATKSLEITKNYIEMHLAGNVPLETFYDGKTPEEILMTSGVIDIMAWQYGLDLGAMHDAEEWLLERGEIKKPLPQEWCQQEGAIYCNPGVECSADELAAVAQQIRGDIDELYALKKSVLDIAEKTGEAEYRGNHRTKQYWTKFMRWGVYTYHLPRPDRQTRILDNLYKDDMDGRTFTPRKQYRPFTSAEIQRIKDVLKQYVDQNDVIVSLCAAVKAIVDGE